MHWIKSVLFAPYLIKSSVAVRLKIIGAAVLFIILFHAVFQPFQFRLYPFATKAEVLVSYTIISFLVASLNLFVLPVIFRKWFNEDNWTRLKEWIWVMWNIFSVGAGFFLFKISFGFYPLGYEQIITGVLATIAVGILPITLYVILGHAYILKQELESFRELNNKLSERQNSSPQTERVNMPGTGLITIKAQRGEQDYSFLLHDLIYMESSGNYITIGHYKNDSFKTDKIRSSLSAIENLLSSYKEIIRPHRAFLVNSAHIKSIEGNSSGYKITFPKTEICVPVSRSKIKEIRALVGLS